MEASCAFCNATNILFIKGMQHRERTAFDALCCPHHVNTHIEMEASCAFCNATNILFIKGMQHRERMAFDAFCYPHHVSTSMKKAISLLVKTSQNPLWQEVKTRPLGNNHNKGFPSPKIPMLYPPHKKKPFIIPRLLE